MNDLAQHIFKSEPALPGRHYTLILTAMALFTTSFAVWSHFARIDEQVRAEGSFIASSRSQVIQAVDGGSLKQLLVHQGDKVRAGELLAVLDPQRYEASQQEIAAKVAGLKANIARLNAELNGGEPEFPQEVKAQPQLMSAQIQLMRQRRRALEEDVGSLTRSLDLARKEADAFRRLATTGDASETEVLKSQRAVTDLEGQITSMRNKYLQDSRSDLADFRDQLGQAEQQLNARESIVAATQIRTPTDGVVKYVKFTTIGAVLKAGDELMEIVPTDDPLLVEAKVQPSDVAFLRQGLPANIKLSAYDYTIYGSIKGHVTYISPDTLTEDTPKGQVTYYRVQIASDDPAPKTLKGEPFDIIPGMQANVEIRTGDRTVANYLLKPLRRAASESLTER